MDVLDTAGALVTPVASALIVCSTTGVELIRGVVGAGGVCDTGMSAGATRLTLGNAGTGVAPR